MTTRSSSQRSEIRRTTRSSPSRRKPGSALSAPCSRCSSEALLVAAVWSWRSGQEIGSFTLAVAACLALSPVVWLHYLTLLIAPLGLARPRFSALWLLPIVLWVSPRDENGDGLHPFVPMVVVVALIGLLVARPRSEPALEAGS